ncbi:hypothetical protein ACFPH6_15355 [Streptomyces xiangluensis]|uniref:Uncharacterized protein n=1 Tax=Streptomyces xiangluensis TaxID=2665720 RepID=A0ABV8YP94_9ACTN
MAKNRITPTFDPGENAANHEAVADYGLDLSALLRIAALAEAARVRRAQGRFAEVDAVSRAAEESTPDIPPGTAPGDGAAMDAYLDAIDTYTDIGS